MPAIGVSMQKIKEILRLHFDAKLSQHQIAASLQVSSGVVNKYLSLAKAAQLCWPLPAEVDEAQLRVILKPYQKEVEPNRHELDYASIHQELKNKGVTLLLLWQEYENTGGYPWCERSRFCFFLYVRF